MFIRSRPSLATARKIGLAMLALAACGAPPVEWSPVPSTVAMLAGPAVLRVDGTLQADSMAVVAARVSPPPGPACAGSLRIAAARDALVGVWWAPRPDSGVRLLAARSTDGGTSWSAAAAVDTTDAGVGGCNRAAAAIAADPASSYVHVSYALEATEGPGLFFSHSMDEGVTFHAPVPILYGERLGRTSVAADGDLVVVGFEDPNSSTPRIGLALSRTMGHIFEHRILPVSDDHDVATRPLVAVRRGRVAIAWQRGASTPAGGPATVAVRTGMVR
jgi:hypothetical protein